MPDIGLQKERKPTGYEKMLLHRKMLYAALVCAVSATAAAAAAMILIVFIVYFFV